MGHRLSKIYTRTGDDGTTGLGDGARTPKDSLRVETFGTVDELNSAIGIILSYSQLSPNIQECLTEIQHKLFDLGGELCLPGYVGIKQEHVDELEHSLDGFNEHLKPLKEFILPGGHPAAAHCQLARAIGRRAERRVITLAKQEDISPIVIKYLNRLSDLLFVIARFINFEQQCPEPLWKHERKKNL